MDAEAIKGFTDVSLKLIDNLWEHVLAGRQAEAIARLEDIHNIISAMRGMAQQEIDAIDEAETLREEYEEQLGRPIEESPHCGENVLERAYNSCPTKNDPDVCHKCDAYPYCSMTKC